MIGKVFRIFGERGGLLKALGLWEWFESLPPDRQKAVKKYYSIKVIKNLNFPYKAKHFDSGEIERLFYTKRTFLATIAQTALLEGDLRTARWLYESALQMEGSPYEAHLILNDLLLLAQKEKDFESMKRYCKMDVELFPRYRDEIKRLNGGEIPQLNTFEVMVYLLEREGKIKEALDLADRMVREGITYPYYEQVRGRLLEKLRDEREEQTA